jgi:hypothetical protein
MKKKEVQTKKPRGRPPGSHQVKAKFPGSKEALARARELSEATGFPLEQIINDALKSGLIAMRGVYAGLINYRKSADLLWDQEEEQKASTDKPWTLKTPKESDEEPYPPFKSLNPDEAEEYLAKVEEELAREASQASNGDQGEQAASERSGDALQRPGQQPEIAEAGGVFDPPF